jgi:D-serine deaminase-like pyridoxal phosphate-dependent protein
MGYEGHVVGLTERTERESGVAASTTLLRAAHVAVGGDVVSGGGTGTWDLNGAITELQAGSYTLMDTAYAALGLPFRQAVWVLGSVISVNPTAGFAVADVGLKSLGMDHGNPSVEGGRVWFCSDEHLTFGPPKGTSFADWGVRVGDRVRVWPAHIDPTIAMHTTMHVVSSPDATAVVDTWPVDLRNW